MTIIDYIVLFLMFVITLLIHDLLLFKKESKESKTLKLKKVPAHVKQFADPLRRLRQLQRQTFKSI